MPISLTAEEREQAIAYCEALANNMEAAGTATPLVAAVVAAAHVESRDDDGGPYFHLDTRLHWTRAAAMIRAGWVAGEPTPAQWLAGTVAVAARLLVETGADVSTQCVQVEPRSATYVIAATGDAL